MITAALIATQAIAWMVCLQAAHLQCLRPCRSSSSGFAAFPLGSGSGERVQPRCPLRPGKLPQQGVSAGLRRLPRAQATCCASRKCGGPSCAWCPCPRCPTGSASSGAGCPSATRSSTWATPPRARRVLGPSRPWIPAHTALQACDHPHRQASCWATPRRWLPQCTPLWGGHSALRRAPSNPPLSPNLPPQNLQGCDANRRAAYPRPTPQCVHADGRQLQLMQGAVIELACRFSSSLSHPPPTGPLPSAQAARISGRPCHRILRFVPAHGCQERQLMHGVRARAGHPAV